MTSRRPACPCLTWPPPSMPMPGAPNGRAGAGPGSKRAAHGPSIGDERPPAKAETILAWVRQFLADQAAEKGAN